MKKLIMSLSLVIMVQNLTWSVDKKPVHRYESGDLIEWKLTKKIDPLTKKVIKSVEAHIDYKKLPGDEKLNYQIYHWKKNGMKKPESFGKKGMNDVSGLLYLSILAGKAAGSVILKISGKILENKKMINGSEQVEEEMLEMIKALFEFNMNNPQLEKYESINPDAVSIGKEFKIQIHT